jgi:hypothetical protein
MDLYYKCRKCWERITKWLWCKKCREEIDADFKWEWLKHNFDYYFRYYQKNKNGKK